MLRAMLLGTAVSALALGLWACPVAAPPGEPASPPAPEISAEDFSGERAQRHVEALERLAASAAGSDAAQRTREYLTGALRELGIEVSELRTQAAQGVPETVNLVASVPGRSADPIVLVARIDPEPGPAPDAASGAALVLELGRALQARAPEFTLLLAFVEGDVGIGALLAVLAEQDQLARARLAVVFEQVAVPIARDLRSSRPLREEFWASARRLGQTQVFPPDAPFEAVDGAGPELAAAGMRRFVAIARSTAPAAEAAAPAADAQHASRAGLAAVGAVSLDAIDAISQRLARIDRFARSPLSDAAEPAAH